MSRPLHRNTLTKLPPVWPHDALEDICQQLARVSHKVFILDDDPTGTQTVRDLRILTRWDVPRLRRQWQRSEPGCFILTNSRALPTEATRSLHREIARNLLISAAGQPFTIISRSDSTLRGHYPAETDTLNAELGGFDLTVLAPFFKAGGRLTLHGEHYLLEEDTLIPVALTPFAKDPSFPFSTSFLPAYVAEKSKNQISADEVLHIDIDLIRQRGPKAVAELLQNAPRGSVCVVDACEDRDIEVFAAGALAAEAAGQRILYRTAAAFVAARLGQSIPELLKAETFRGDFHVGGLIVVGSHVPLTTLQLEALREDRRLEFLELEVKLILDDSARQPHLEHLARSLQTHLKAGRTSVLYTSRNLTTGIDSTGSLAIGRRISNSLVDILLNLEVQPRFIVAKGGITSSDIASRALHVDEAWIRGQILPGVPVWGLGEESRFPGMTYVVFPGNVGHRYSLCEAVKKLL